MKIIDPGLKFTNDTTVRKTTKYIALHHAAKSICSVYDIHRWHLQNGWAGIGYHYFVRKDGSIYRGREENRVGAHVSNSNNNSIGICFEGDYENADKVMPDAQWWAGIELIKDINTRYSGVDIVGHKFFGGSVCPGKHFPLPGMINAVNEVKPFDKTAIRYNGVQVDFFGLEVKTIDGHNYVPVRFFAEALGKKVTWNGEMNSVDIVD